MRDNPIGVRANAQVCMYMRALYACGHVSLRANEKNNYGYRMPDLGEWFQTSMYTC